MVVISESSQQRSSLDLLPLLSIVKGLWLDFYKVLDINFIIHVCMCVLCCMCTCVCECVHACENVRAKIHEVTVCLGFCSK